MHLRDIVIIDTSTALDYADAVIVSRSVDAVVLVVSAGRSGRRDVHSTLRMLSRARTRLAGVVLTTEVADMKPSPSQSSHRKVKQ